VLITATFVGPQVAGPSGALAGTVEAFAAPWTLTRAVAHQVRRFAQDRRLLAFGAGAAPAVIGILGVSALALSREVFVSWAHVGIGGVIFAVATWTRINPVGLLALGGFPGWSLELR
jgi:chromate transporter